MKFKIIGISFWIAQGLWAAAAQDANTLAGSWTGIVHQNIVLRADCHQAVYDSGFQLALQIVDDQVTGQGTGYVTSPVVTPMPCINKQVPPGDWSATYAPGSFSVTVKGFIASSRTVIWIQITPPERLSIHAHYTYRNDPPKDLTLQDDTSPFPTALPLVLKPVRIGAFSQHVHHETNDHLGLIQPTDFLYASEDAIAEDVVVDGHFERTVPPWEKAALALGALLSFLGLGAGALKWLPGSNGSSMVWALMGALFGALEKFQDWGVIQPSFNPTTGLPLAGSHLGYPLGGLGSAAKWAGGGLALLSQFQESYSIWNDSGSVSNRVLREGVSLNLNIATALSSAALVGAAAETGPGLALGIAGSVFLGVGGEWVKSQINGLINRRIP